MTKQYRTSDMNRLFLTYKKPYKEANKQSISRWIRIMLTNSGLDTAIFSAHTTRHAATSAAARKGVLLDTIFRTAGWTRRSTTFAKFYNKPLAEQGEFSMAILQP